MYENKRILVFGLAKSGYAVAKLLSKNNDILVVDAKDDDIEKIRELEKLGINFIKSNEVETLINKNIDLIVKNPGINPNHVALVKARSLNILIVNEIEVAYHYLKKNVQIIGVTGSNGKTTTSTIIYEILNKMFDNVHLAGNIGVPLSQIVDKTKENDILVLEISDHQLYDLVDFKTNISVLTNLCQTHLDFHGNYENYKNVKKKIFNNHTSLDLAVINYDNEDSLNITNDINSFKRYFNGSDAFIKDNSIFVKNEKIIKLDEILIKGKHNYENIMAALLAIEPFGLNIKIIKEVLSTFKGVEHRLEFVTRYNNINIYNDSKATNPTSTIVALTTFDKPIHLILGGYERGQDFNELNDYLNNVKCIYAIGECENRVKDWADKLNKKVIICDVLDRAVSKIKENVCENEIVLLSPSSASWDQFPNFETRGDEFKKFVAFFFN